ncbi:MAG: hypothetical protein RML15_04270 [Bacteroidota bacterium]|nr:hypothetical protein [Candidatus Kapabacteria bacterium]MCS7301881.1 hypothetical protein [Candidatus Kapabacteria bacterium]MCX7936134.1 hypothetical protein [Chlorobiota bacterium]MDW8074972.1 hypothetical protein [Bacteroidota bacterium]MDW8271611.1 hypothetical protein [Bacteroidota bacterium]
MQWYKLLALAVIASATVDAQLVRRGEASPIAPEVTLYDYRGVIVGVPILLQQGQYLDTCLCPPFEKGSGSGILAGIFYELPAEKSSALRLGISGGLDYRRLVAQYREQEPLTFSSLDGMQRFSGIPVEFRQRMSFDFFTLWAQPYVRLVPMQTEAITAGVGAYVGYMAIARAVHTKTLLQNTVRLPNGEVIGVQMADGGNTATVRDGDMLEVNRLSAFAVFRVESRISVGDVWFLRPGIHYHLPLTTLSSSGGMKLSAIMFTLSLARQAEQ